MDQKVCLLEKNLKELGYDNFKPFKLTDESVDLVDQILSDLIHTTQNLKHYKDLVRKLLEERDEFKLGLEPYKCDNARLLNENNILHLKLMKLDEENQQIVKDLKRKIRKLEHDNSQQQSKICKLECDLFKRSLKKPADINSEKMSRRKGIKERCCKCGDLLQQSQKEIENLNSEVKNLKDDNNTQLELIQSLKTQLVNRDQEIERMMKLLRGGRSYSVLSEECCYKDVEEKLSKLSFQITDLQLEKKMLQEQLEEAIKKQHEAMANAVNLAEKNKRLEKELLEVDHLALTVETDCNTTIKKNAEKILTLQDQLHQAHLKIMELEKEISDVNTYSKEKESLKKKLDCLTNEKMQLEAKLKHFNVIEQDLNAEIDRLTQTNILQKRQIEELKLQLSDLREKEKLKEQNSNDDKSSKSDQSVQSKDEKTIYSCKHKIHCKKCGGRETNEEVFNCKEKISLLQAERDRYYNECKYYKNKIDRSELPEKPSENILELNRKLNEKDQIIKNLQQEIHDLSRKNHNLEMQILELKEEDRWLGEPSKNIEKTRTVLKKLELDLDIARSDIRRLEQERNDLRGRLRVATDYQLSERRRYEKIFQDYENRIKQLENERHEYIMETGSWKGIISKLENQCSTYKDRFESAETELNHLRTLYSQLKTLQEQTDLALSESQAAQVQLTNELKAAQNREKENSIISENIKSELLDVKSELTAMESRLHELDCERDKLMLQLDEKTEHIVQLKEDLKQKNKRICCLEEQVNTLQQKLCTAADELNSGRVSSRSLQSELCQLRQELENLKKERDCCLAENSKLQNEIVNATYESKKMSQKLEVAQNEIEDLKRQLQGYVTEVSRIEDILAEKEKERNELLSHFRQLSEEATALENNNNCLENKAAAAECELQSLNRKVDELQNILETKESICKSYQCQIEKLTTNIACLESQIKQLLDQQDEADCAITKLNEERLQVMKENDEKESSKRRVEYELKNLRTEICELQNEILSKTEVICQLEDQMKCIRQENKCYQRKNQELSQEIMEQQETINKLQRKLIECQRQASDYKTKYTQLQNEIISTPLPPDNTNIDSPGSP